MLSLTFDPRKSKTDDLIYQCIVGNDDEDNVTPSMTMTNIVNIDDHINMMNKLENQNFKMSYIDDKEE